MRSSRSRWIRVGEKLKEELQGFFRNLLLLFLGAYRTIGTTHLGGGCRFEPSCSEYAVEAARTHAPHRALGLIFHRVIKCRPGGPWGFDPVPCTGHQETA